MTFGCWYPVISCWWELRADRPLHPPCCCRCRRRCCSPDPSASPTIELVAPAADSSTRRFWAFYRSCFLFTLSVGLRTFASLVEITCSFTVQLDNCCCSTHTIDEKKVRIKNTSTCTKSWRTSDSSRQVSGYTERLYLSSLYLPPESAVASPTPALEPPFGLSLCRIAAGGWSSSSSREPSGVLNEFSRFFKAYVVLLLVDVAWSGAPRSRLDSPAATIKTARKRRYLVTIILPRL